MHIRTPRGVKGLVWLLAGVGLAACNGRGVFAYKEPTVTLINLGPALAAGDSYRQSATTPAGWSGFCPIPDQSAVLVSAGDPFSFVNRTDRTLIIASPLAPSDTIAAGKQGHIFQSYGNPAQFSTVLEYRVNGCTDTLNGRPLFTVTVVQH